KPLISHVLPRIVVDASSLRMIKAWLWESVTPSRLQRPVGPVRNPGARRGAQRDRTKARGAMLRFSSSEPPWAASGLAAPWQHSGEFVNRSPDLAGALGKVAVILHPRDIKHPTMREERKR